MFLVGDSTFAQVPSVMERKWNIFVNDQGECVYRIGWDVKGRSKYKTLLEYVPGHTERVYGFGQDRRLRIRALDAKDIGEIVVGFDKNCAEDWRPIWLKGYQGPLEDAETRLRGFPGA